MKPVFKISIFLLLLVTVSCLKEETSLEYPYEAEVVGRNADCGLYAVKIINGLPAIKSIVGTTVGDSIYIAKNLPADYEVAGLRIMIDVRKPLPKETSICTAMGPSYSWLYIKKAIRKVSGF